jgi:hypothetical protein
VKYRLCCLSWQVVLGSATTGALLKSLEPFLIVKTLSLAEVYTIGYRNVGLYKPFLLVCWFLKTDRYFFLIAFLLTSVNPNSKKVPVYIENSGYILFLKFYTT